jgi:hypothetical protein
MSQKLLILVLLLGGLRLRDIRFHIQSASEVDTLRANDGVGRFSGSGAGNKDCPFRETDGVGRAGDWLRIVIPFWPRGEVIRGRCKVRDFAGYFHPLPSVIEGVDSSEDDSCEAICC